MIQRGKVREKVRMRGEDEGSCDVTSPSKSDISAVLVESSGSRAEESRADQTKPDQVSQDEQ